jgi:hypothetical protein
MTVILPGPTLTEGALHLLWWSQLDAADTPDRTFLEAGRS